ncbi:DoxX family protein [Neptunitalea chrysea]|nr:hypothetical protein [Neptunitalea chrysea]
MKPFIVLLATFSLLLISTKLYGNTYDFKLSGRVALIIMLLFTSIAHFIYTKGMAAMIPQPIPYKKEVVLFTGILEILFAISLLFPTISIQVGWGLILFLLLITPANIYGAIASINYQNINSLGPGISYLWIRIPIQIIYLCWVYFFIIK